jgi:CRISPR-associated protein Csx17
MSTITLTGVSGASLGELLKGYGIIATLGSKRPDALFWWDSALHLVIGGDSDQPDEQLRELLLCILRGDLMQWANDIGRGFQKQRADKKKGIKGGDSPLKESTAHDSFEPYLAEAASAIAVFAGGRVRSHPLFPGFGQDGSANYFKTLQAEADKLQDRKNKNKSTDLEISLFGHNGGAVEKRLEGTGGLYFSGAIKRYATGLAWVHEKDAPLSGWDFLLAIRGALLLRGAVRSFRGSRRSYPSFPFVFRGSPIKAGGKLFVVDEVYLPTWSSNHPRTLAELQIQIRQFQARVGGGDFASSAADFRRAVQGRGVTGGFDQFHRFVLERRKPGQRQPAVQAVARGATAVGKGATELRLLLARIDESGWLDQLEQPNVPSDRRDEQLQLAARRVHDAIHACADEPTAHRHLDILDTLWLANRLLLDRADSTRVRPLSPMPAQRWERVLAEMLKQPEGRIARALASIGWNGWDTEKKRWRTGSPWPIASQILPVEYIGVGQVSCRVPDRKLAARTPWRSFQPERDFGRLFHRRWLDALGRNSRDVLPYAATRTAPLGDVVKLLHGQLSLSDIQRFCSAFLVLDWCRALPLTGSYISVRGPVPVAYAALRLWLDAEINPLHDRRANWDGSIPQLLFRGDPDAVNAACRLAIARLRVTGLPTQSLSERRAGNAVAAPVPKCTVEEARLMALAVLVPIDSSDTERLARRLWIPTNEEPQTEEAAYA